MATTNARVALTALVLATSLATNTVFAANFTPTSIDNTLIKWIDLDSIQGSTEEKTAYEYAVYRSDQKMETNTAAPLIFAIIGTKVTFLCNSHHFRFDDSYMYSSEGNLVKSYEGEAVPTTIVSPQTAISEEYDILCSGKPVQSFKDIPPDVKPLQFLVGLTRTFLQKH